PPDISTLSLHDALPIWALRVEWGLAEAIWEEAEKWERAKERFDHSGRDRRHFNRSRCEQAWAKAAAALERACEKERAWTRVVAADRKSTRLNSSHLVIS